MAEASLKAKFRVCARSVASTETGWPIPKFIYSEDKRVLRFKLMKSPISILERFRKACNPPFPIVNPGPPVAKNEHKVVLAKIREVVTQEVHSAVGKIRLEKLEELVEDGVEDGAKKVATAFRGAVKRALASTLDPEIDSFTSVLHSIEVFHGLEAGQLTELNFNQIVHLILVCVQIIAYLLNGCYQTYLLSRLRGAQGLPMVRADLPPAVTAGTQPQYLCSQCSFGASGHSTPNNIRGRGTNASFAARGEDRVGLNF